MSTATRSLVAFLVVSGLALSGPLELSVARAQSPAVPAPSALEPASTGGLAVVDRALAKLATHSRLLVIGAHPDDEDTTLLTLVSVGMGGEAAYLSLSRGDGGQNLIGSELGEGLGLVRTQELLAARRVDGAHQYFTRAFDFGYTRSIDETLRRWPREVLLEDVARVVWRFRPQVVVAMFSPEIGGHGQHLASGWAAQEAFAAGVDGLPEGVAERLMAEGLEPWQPAALYRPTWFDPDRATLEVPIGQVEPLSGRSITQIAMLSRSQHRSQDMGMLQPLGLRRAGLEWVAGGAGAAATGLFDGVDTSLAGIAAGLPPGEPRRVVEAALAEVERAAVTARRGLSPANVSASVTTLAGILETLRGLQGLLSGDQSGAGRVVAELLREKTEIAEAGLAAAAGVGVEALSDREATPPGAAAEIDVSIWDSGEPDAQVVGVEIAAAEDWSIEELSDAEVDEHGLEHWRFGARVAESAGPSAAYFLRSPRRGDLYDWDGVEPEVRGLPYQAPELVASVEMTIAGQTVTLNREVVHRSRDQAVGEVRRPLRIVPRVELSVDPGTLLWDVRDADPRPVRVTLRSHLDEPVSGRLRSSGSDGWRTSEPSFSIDEPGGETTFEVVVSPPGSELASGRYEIAFRAELAGGVTESTGVPLLEYPHIRPTPRPVAARLGISAFELDLPEVGPIGYVRGASDRVPELLRLVGAEVELLGEEDLLRGDLGRYRVILIGSRAYETDPTLVAANGRLLDFVRDGGRLVVQYQQYQFSRGGFAPFAFEILPTRPPPSSPSTPTIPSSSAPTG